MNFSKWLFVFLVLNYGALYIGNILMDNGPQTQWYQNLNQAPWTPPGWLFGVAWTTIMFCFSIYMAYLYRLIPEYQVILLFGIQFMLNVSWNYVFFKKQHIALGFIVILLLTFVIALLLCLYAKPLKSINLLIIQYLLWLIISYTLNVYILFNN